MILAEAICYSARAWQAWPSRLACAPHRDQSSRLPLGFFVVKRMVSVRQSYPKRIRNLITRAYRCHNISIPSSNDSPIRRHNKRVLARTMLRKNRNRASAELGANIDYLRNGAYSGLQESIFELPEHKLVAPRMRSTSIEHALRGCFDGIVVLV